MCYSAMIEQDVKLLESRFGAIKVRASWDNYESLRTADPPLPPLESRIYPGYFAPVVTVERNQHIVHLMKYSVEPPDFINDSRRYTSYNARRDNLSSPFWSECFRKHHGLVLLKVFFEWVAVKDLVKAGHVTLAAVKQEFDRQKDMRRDRLKAAGKPYRPTKAELTNPLFRKVVIEFKTAGGADLLTPVVYSRREGPTGHPHMGFAIVTDEPPPEVERAGHDRCPVFLKPEAAEQWLRGAALPAEQLDELLAQRPLLTFDHQLSTAA